MPWNLLCGKACKRKKFPNCFRRPHLTISEQGVKIDIQVDLLILFIGKTQRHNIVNANAELDVTVSRFTLLFLKHLILEQFLM